MSKLSVIGIIIIIAVICIFATRKCNRFAGNGTITSENRTVSSFTKLKLDGVCNTIITQDGKEESVTVETDQNLQSMVIVQNNGETLNISTKSFPNFSNATKMVVHVNVKNLTSIVNSSVGSVGNTGTLKTPTLYLKTEAVGKTIRHIETDKLTADLNSVGAIELSGAAINAEIDNNSVGKLDADRLKVDVLNLRNNAVGAVEIYADKELSIDHNGVGAVRYRGPAALKKLTDNGVGKVSKSD